MWKTSPLGSQQFDIRCDALHSASVSSCLLWELSLSVWWTIHIHFTKMVMNIDEPSKPLWLSMISASSIGKCPSHWLVHIAKLRSARQESQDVWVCWVWYRRSNSHRHLTLQFWVWLVAFPNWFPESSWVISSQSGPSTPRVKKLNRWGIRLTIKQDFLQRFCAICA